MFSSVTHLMQLKSLHKGFSMINVLWTKYEPETKKCLTLCAGFRSARLLLKISRGYQNCFMDQGVKTPFWFFSILTSFLDTWNHIFASEYTFKLLLISLEGRAGFKRICLTNAKPKWTWFFLEKAVWCGFGETKPNIFF